MNFGLWVGIGFRMYRRSQIRIPEVLCARFAHFAPRICHCRMAVIDAFRLDNARAKAPPIALRS